MKREEFSNPLVIISAALFLIFIGVMIKIYFVDAVIDHFEKKDVSDNEKIELRLLTEAYLVQNSTLKLNKILKTPIGDNRYNVAAEYYFLKNGKDGLNNYDEILELSKRMFNNEYIEFANFEVDIDENRCGKEKYTTINGIVYNENCDSKEIVYEINDIYEMDEKYIVEFYAARAFQEKTTPIHECKDYKAASSYNLILNDLLEEEFYNENYSQCCEDICELEGIYPFRNEIIDRIKSHGIIYKMIFEKIDSDFVFKEVKK